MIMLEKRSSSEEDNEFLEAAPPAESLPRDALCRA
jgi:hypothetical protein